MNNNVSCRQVISGLGGIGKTRLAIEYAWKYQERYNAELFVVAATPAQLRRSVADLAAPGILNLQEWECNLDDIRMVAVISWLSEHPGWLLIIDNADKQSSVKSVKKLLPALRQGHVIITSRNHDWRYSATQQEIDVLSIEESKKFLLERTNDLRLKTPHDEAVAEELARELGGLALVLEQAGAYIQNRDGGLSLADYLARWREGGNTCTWCNRNVKLYDRSVSITWETTARALSPAALTLFRILSWFAPDPIPRRMVSDRNVIEIISAAVEKSGLEKSDIDPELALGELIAYSMTKKVDEQGTPCVGLHRVVLQITRDQMPLEVKAPSVVAAAKMLELFAPKESYRPENWMKWRLLISHAEAIYSILSKLEEEYWNIELMKMLALYYMGQERNKDGVPIQRKVLRWVQKYLDPDDPEIFLAMNDLALMLDFSAEEEKETLYKEALDGRCLVLGEESEAAGETRHNYGCFLSSYGRLAEAEPLMLRALSTHAKVNGPFHWRTLMAETSLADIFLDKGEVAKAEDLICSSLVNKKKHLGEEHPDTLKNMESLAWVLVRRADFDEAEKLLLQVFETRKRVLGSGEPSTIDTMNDLASFYCRIDNCAQAEKLLKQALDLNENNQGSQHYRTLRSIYMLANFYAFLGNAAVAKPLYWKAIDGMRLDRGSDRPETLQIMSDLANLLQHSGERMQAEKIYREVMETNKRVRGDEHQMTLNSINRLAIFYDETGDEASAEKMYRDALDGLTKKRGTDHRDTLVVLGNYAELLREKGDYEEAEKLFKSIVETNVRLYGKEHLMTYNSMNQLAIFFTRIENYEMAEQYFNLALEGKQRIQGPKHPDTLILMSNLADLLAKKGEYEHAEALFDKVIEINECELGKEHPNTLASLLKLAELLEKSNKIEESLKIRDRYIEVKVRKSDTASLVSLRELALQFYLKGEYKRAEELLLIVLDQNFQIPGICCQLVRLFIVTDRDDNARKMLSKALENKEKAEPYVIPRILFLQILFDFLDGNILEEHMGILKSVLKTEREFHEWKLKPVLNHLEKRLSESAFVFLNALSDALCDKKKLKGLDRFSEWCSVEPVASQG
jgi:tetratricopeptide (TPR) repeat protein